MKPAGILEIKRGEYLREKTDELATNSKNKNIKRPEQRNK
jgi:hypothetical protein